MENRGKCKKTRCFLCNWYTNVIIYKIEKSREKFCLWTSLQNFPIHIIRALYIDVSLYPKLTIQESTRLKRSANHLLNNSDVCRKKFDEWSSLEMNTYVLIIQQKRKNILKKNCNMFLNTKRKWSLIDIFCYNILISGPNVNKLKYSSWQKDKD